MAFLPRNVRLGAQHPLVPSAYRGKDVTMGILASVSLRGPHSGNGLQGIRKQARR